MLATLGRNVTYAMGFPIDFVKNPSTASGKLIFFQKHTQIRSSADFAETWPGGKTFEFPIEMLAREFWIFRSSYVFRGSENSASKKRLRAA